MKEIKGIFACNECHYYDIEHDFCTKGAIDNGYSSHMFLNDCPLPDVSLVVLAQWEETEEYDDEYGYFEKTYHCSKCQSSFSVKTLLFTILFILSISFCGAKIKNNAAK